VRHESLPCPARGLELVVYPLEIARAGTTEPGFVLNLNTGARMAYRLDLEPDPAEAHWFAIDRSILSAHGIAIVGRPAADVFAPIPFDDLVPVVLASLEWHQRRLERRWSSKDAAAAWAEHQLTSPTRPRRRVARGGRAAGEDAP
jgi:hypothetical protein